MSSSDTILLDCSDDSAVAVGFEKCATSEGGGAAEPQQKLTKSQQKKRARMERFNAGKAEWRRKQRERHKERKRARKADGHTGAVVHNDRPYKLNTMNESKCRVRVAVDMAYDDLMDERSVCKTVSQLRHCYASNRRAADPLQFYVVNLDTKAKKVLDGITGWQQWDVHLLAQPLAKLWDDREIVYLTADSENVLSALDEQKVYVIGGLLDHNHQKGLCLRRAIEKGYAHAKLPIGDFVQMSTRKVLAINHVFEILLHFTRDPNWERAFLAVIPKRKLPQQAAEEAVVIEELESTNEAATSERTVQNGDGKSGASNDKEHGDVQLVMEDDGRKDGDAPAQNEGRQSEEDGDQRREDDGQQRGEGSEKCCELISSDQCHPSPPLA